MRQNWPSLAADYPKENVANSYQSISILTGVSLLILTPFFAFVTSIPSKIYDIQSQFALIHRLLYVDSLGFTNAVNVFFAISCCFHSLKFSFQTSSLCFPIWLASNLIHSHNLIYPKSLLGFPHLLPWKPFEHVRIILDQILHFYTFNWKNFTNSDLISAYSFFLS